MVAVHRVRASGLSHFLSLVSQCWFWYTIDRISINSHFCKSMLANTRDIIYISTIRRIDASQLIPVFSRCLSMPEHFHLFWFSFNFFRYNSIDIYNIHIWIAGVYILCIGNRWKMSCRISSVKNLHLIICICTGISRIIKIKLCGYKVISTYCNN